MLGGGTHSKFIHGLLTQNDRTSLQQFLHHSGIVGRDKVLQHFRAAGGGQFSSAEQIFQAKWCAAQKTGPALGPVRICTSGLCQCLFGPDREVGLDAAIHRFNTVQV